MCRKQTCIVCIVCTPCVQASPLSAQVFRQFWAASSCYMPYLYFQATLKHAIEDMFDSPGFLIAQMTASGPPPTKPPSATHGLDMAAVTNMYTSILRVRPLWLLPNLFLQVAQQANRLSNRCPGIHQGGWHGQTCCNPVGCSVLFGVPFRLQHSQLSLSFLLMACAGACRCTIPTSSPLWPARQAGWLTGYRPPMQPHIPAAPTWRMTPCGCAPCSSSCRSSRSLPWTATHLRQFLFYLLPSCIRRSSTRHMTSTAFHCLSRPKVLNVCTGLTVGLGGIA